MKYYKNLKMNFQIIVLAAGHGSRMNSNLPKVMHKLVGKPMLEYVLENAFASTKDVILVHSIELENFWEELPITDKSVKILQQERLGTGHAVKVALNVLSKYKATIVLFGDNPLISNHLICHMIKKLEKDKLDLLTLGFQGGFYRGFDGKAHAEYGRLVTDNDGNFIKIVEYKDANEEERNIQLYNSGVMAFSSGTLHKFIPLLKNNNLKKEYYLTDIVNIIREEKGNVSYLISDEEILGVNTISELRTVEKIIETSLSRP